MYMQEISTVLIVFLHSVLTLFIHLLFSLSFIFILVNLSIFETARIAKLKA